ncbi:hypothetical protein [Streptomyces sp. NPDC055400]
MAGPVPRAPTEETLTVAAPAGGPAADLLLPVELAALCWAEVDPDEHETWVVHRGDCPVVADDGSSPWR